MTSKTASSRLEAVSSGPNTRKLRRLRVQLHHVAQELAHARAWLRPSPAGLRHVDGVVAEIRQPQIAQQQRRRWRAGSHPSVGAPSGASVGELRTQRAVLVEQLLGLDSSASTLRAAQVLGLFVQSASGTWCERKEPSIWTPSTTFGPVQPLGVRSTIIGQRGRSVDRRARASRLDLANVLDDLVEGRGHQLVHRCRVVALDEVRACSRSPDNRSSSSSCGMRASTVGLAIL